MPRFHIRGSAIAVLAFVVATTAGTSSATPTNAVKSNVGRLDTALRAVNTAERSVPAGGKAYDIETDRLRGKRVWEVKVARGVARPYEVDVRADGRAVVRQQRQSRIGDDVRRVAKAKITLARAMTAAAAHAAGTVFSAAEIDRSGGRIVWQAEFEQSADREIEVTVDAQTGNVISVRTDS